MAQPARNGGNRRAASSASVKPARSVPQRTPLERIPANAEELNRSAKARDSERLVHTYKVVPVRFVRDMPTGFLGWHIIDVISKAHCTDGAVELTLLLESDDVS